MKCYIDISDDFPLEAYIKYLKDIFKITFKIRSSLGSFILLESIENKYRSYLLVRGENYNVASLLSKISILEKNIILVTCTSPLVINIAKQKNQTLTKNKTIFFPIEQNENYLTPLYNGADYGLEFDPCKSEYLLGRYCEKKGVYNCLDELFYKKKVREC